MPRGGKREGAGRKHKGNHLNPQSIEEIKQKIKADWLIRKLNAHIESGEGKMVPSAVTAALGLLRKVTPDLQAIEHKGVVAVKPAELMTDDELAGSITQARATLVGTVAGTDAAPVDPSKLN